MVVENIAELDTGNIIERIVRNGGKTYTGYYKIISFPDGFVPPSNTDELDETQLPNGERVFLQYI